ncbi:MAG: tetratricopeptide repeat protein, partial [Deltaproteobacteria bacterium]|nr:tetratricopeptide repeat protein [Deltaproteobacteria bacterium]
SAAARVPDPPPPRRAKTLIGLSPAVPPAPPPPPPQLRRPATRGLGSPPHPRPAPPARRPRVTPPAPPAATAASRAAADVVPTELDDAIELEEISPANEGATHESEGATHESESATHESESATPANEGAAHEVVPEPLPKAPEPLPIDEPPAAAPLPYVDHAQPAAPRRPAARPRAEVPWLGIGVGASVILVGIAVAVVIVIASRDDDDDDAVARPAVAAASVGAPPQTAPPSPVALPLGLEAPGTTSRPSAETASPRPPSSSSSVTATARAPRIELARTVTDEVAPDVGAASARARRQLARTLMARGDRSLRRGRLNRASAAYEEALRYAPRSDQAARGMAEARLRLSDHEGALRWARRLVELRPQGADSHMVLGDALLANGDRAGALDAWHTALRIHPRHRGVRYRLTRAARDR